MRRREDENGKRIRVWTRGGNLLTAYFRGLGLARSEWSAHLGYESKNRAKNYADGWASPTARARVTIQHRTGIPVDAWDQPGVPTYTPRPRDGKVQQPPRPWQTSRDAEMLDEARTPIDATMVFAGRERTTWDRETILTDIRGRLARMMLDPETPSDIVERVALAFRSAPEREVLRVFGKLWDRRQSSVA